MIKYKINVLESLKEAGYTPARLRREKLISECQIQGLRHDEMIGMKTLNAICRVLDMQPGNIIKYVEDPPPED